MQRYAWNWDRWWIFTFFKLLPLTTVGLSPRPTMGASFLLLGFFISLTNALVLGIFLDENKFQSQIIEIPCYFSSEEVVTSLTPNSPSRRTLHPQLQDTYTETRDIVDPAGNTFTCLYSLTYDAERQVNIPKTWNKTVVTTIKMYFCFDFLWTLSWSILHPFPFFWS